MLIQQMLQPRFMTPTNSNFKCLSMSFRKFRRALVQCVSCVLLTCMSGHTAAGFPLNGKLVKASTINTGISIVVWMKMEIALYYQVSPVRWAVRWRRLPSATAADGLWTRRPGSCCLRSDQPVSGLR